MKKKKIAIIVLILGILFFAVGVGGLYFEYLRRERAQQQYESLAALARESTVPETETETVPETEETEETESYVSPIQFEELAAINPDVKGWLRIENTSIDYPIVQTDNNETYLDTDFEGNSSVAGAIFLDFESEPDFSGRHNILYGHHMKNGTMFKDIVKYKEEAYFKEHQNITVYLPDKEVHLKPIAVLYTAPAGIRRMTKFNTEESFQQYVVNMTDGGLVMDMPEEEPARLWSFVTCSYEFNDARTILYAVEVPEVEN